MVSTLDFLTAILPEEGWYCAIVLEGLEARPRQRFVASLDELARIVLDEDHPGRAVYHGCAAYADRKRRQASVRTVRSLWLDVDAGPGKAYADAEEAAHAVLQFSRAAVLPVPLFVGSGLGLHVYWRLARSLTRAEWQPYANGLKVLCHQHSLQADPARTADSASILRPPGTHHRKGEPRLVQCGPLEGPYQPEQFDHVRSIQRFENTRAHSTPRVRGNAAPRGLGETLLAAHAPEIVDFDTLATSCAQLGRFRSSGGNLSEPLWYAGLGVLGHCQDGDAVGHEWSRGYPGYTPEETQLKLDRARALSGPTTCAHFRGLDPETCRGCPHTVASPIALGSNPRSIASEPAKLFNDAPLNGHVSEVVPYSDIGPFHYDATGALGFIGENSKGQATFKKITSYPVYLASIATGEIRRDRHNLHLRHQLPQHGWCDVELPAEQVFGNNANATLAGRNITIYEPDLFRLFIRQSMDLHNNTRKVKKMYEQFGWKDDHSFLYGNRLYSERGVEEVSCSNELRFRAQWLCPSPGGSLGPWTAGVDRLFGRGSEGLSFAVVCSFAAPLMRFLADDEGGAIIHLITPKSGTGKTTVLAAVASVWAFDKRAIDLVNDDTPVAKAITLGALGNLPATYDEFTDKDPEKLAERLTTFTNGRDKMRGTQDGEIRHVQASWQTMLISAANRSLVDALTLPYEPDALTYRILEFGVMSSDTPDLDVVSAKALQKTIMANGGHAGDAYMRYLTQPDVLAWVKKKLPEEASRLHREGRFRKEHRFWTRALGAVSVAAIILERLELISFSRNRLMAWAINHFAATMQADKKNYARIPPSRGVTKALTPAEARRNAVRAFDDGLVPHHAELLSTFIAESAGNILRMPRPWAEGDKAIYPLATPPQRIWGRSDASTRRLFLSEMAVKSFVVMRKTGYRDFVAELTETGVVLAQRPVNLVAGTDLAGGFMHCLEIDMSHELMGGKAAAVDTLANRPEHLKVVK